MSDHPVSPSHSVLVTGSNGFVGKTLVSALAQRGHLVRQAQRVSAAPEPIRVQSIAVGDITPTTDWTEAVRGMDAVVHLAARVHVMRDHAEAPLALFRAVNMQGTLRLAQQAAQAGVRRFVFASTVKVHGEHTASNVPFSEITPLAPEDPYGISKQEAEIGLRQIAVDTGMELVIVRPPLVYGPGVKANFAALMRAVARGWPLPLGALDNRRSLVALDNLVDFLQTCLEHPAAAHQTFLVSDGEDLSTTDLLRRIGQAMHRPARLLPVPAALLTGGAAVLGRRAMAERLCGNLQVDITKARTLLGWTPPISVDEGLRRAMKGLERS